MADLIGYKRIGAHQRCRAQGTVDDFMVVVSSPIGIVRVENSLTSFTSGINLWKVKYTFTRQNFFIASLTYTHSHSDLSVCTGNKPIIRVSESDKKERLRNTLST